MCSRHLAEVFVITLETGALGVLGAPFASVMR